MRLILIFFIFFSCHQPPTSGYQLPIQRNDTIIQVKDSIIYVPVFDYAMKDSMIDEMNALRDSLFIERYKIERVRYYLKIVKRNPKQLKFLVSWINRTVQ